VQKTKLPKSLIRSKSSSAPMAPLRSSRRPRHEPPVQLRQSPRRLNIIPFLGSTASRTIQENGPSLYNNCATVLPPIGQNITLRSCTPTELPGDSHQRQKRSRKVWRTSSQSMAYDIHARASWCSRPRQDCCQKRLLKYTKASNSHEIWPKD